MATMVHMQQPERKTKDSGHRSVSYGDLGKFIDVRSGDALPAAAEANFEMAEEDHQPPQSSLQAPHADPPPPSKDSRRSRSSSYGDIVQVAALAEVQEERELLDENDDDERLTPPEQRVIPRQQWQGNNQKTCAITGCARRFGFMERRHHCRRCGRVVCGSCSQGREMLGPAPESGKAPRRPQRVCNACLGTGTPSVGLRALSLTSGSRSSMSDLEHDSPPSSTPSLREEGSEDEYEDGLRERVGSSTSSEGSSGVVHTLSRDAESPKMHPMLSGLSADMPRHSPEALHRSMDKAGSGDGARRSMDGKGERSSGSGEAGRRSMEVRGGGASGTADTDVLGDLLGRSTGRDLSFLSSTPKQESLAGSFGALSGSSGANKGQGEGGGLSQRSRNNSSSTLSAFFKFGSMWGTNEEQEQTHPQSSLMSSPTRETKSMGISSRYNGGLCVQTDDLRAVEQGKSRSGTVRRRVLPKPETVFEWGGSHIMDRKGMIHFLSTAGGSEPWTNPADSGLIKVKGTPWNQGRMEDVVVSTPDVRNNSWSQDVPDAWVSIELPQGVIIDPSHYTLRHGYIGGAQIRNWQLLTSLDGETWRVAKAHKNDESLVGAYCVHTWKLPANLGPSRFFKVQVTGENSIRGKQLSLSGFEVYGRVVAPQSEGILNPNHWLFAPAPMK